MTQNTQLTDNFWLNEYFVDSENEAAAAELFDQCTPFQEVLAYELALDQQKMRDFINSMNKDDKDIRITNTSGYRDPDLNAAQGSGAVKSLHTLMRGVDFKTEDPAHLKKIYKFITMFSDLIFRECFLYVTISGVPTNIHYAKKAPGYIDRRFGIYVRPADGGKPIRLEKHLLTLNTPDAARFKTF